uniref:CAZy families GT1 protein n=1 Tax=uncultured Pirellula sp. TaxID=298571 RepID=A0A060CKK3_9BACT|nr:CAZy families GT1 protein [uncultured Pirellula sp.]
MAKIFYSMAGEGRGHAVRVRTLTELLRQDHELHLFASDEAFDFLSRFYSAEGPDVRLLRIPGLRFHYSGRGSICQRPSEPGCTTVGGNCRDW